MCGRYALAANGDAIATAMRATPLLPEIAAWRARFNIAPTQHAPVACHDRDGVRRLSLMRWGLVPFWAKDASIGTRLINARSDSLAEKPAFREAWKRRRCLVPATAFYEWQAPQEGSSRTKRPFAVATRRSGDDGAIFALGGLWERWRSPEHDELVSFCVITVDANDLMRPLHHRMPLIVPESAWDRWLGDATPPSDLLAPFDAGAMRAWPVSTLVNNPRNDGPDLLADA